MAERPFVPGQDDAAVLALRAKVWGADHPHTAPAFFDWLFRRTPDGPGAGVVSERDGRIVGFAGLCARRAALGERPLRLAHGLDFMVDPDLADALSGRIALRVLQRHAALGQELGFDLTVNFPNDRSVKMLTSARVGYAPTLRPALFVCAGPAFAETSGSPLRRLALTLAGRAAALWGRARRAPALARRGVSVEPAHGFDADADALWREVARDGRLRFSRDAASLRWRYLDHPVWRYDILAARAGGRLRGVAVTSPRQLLGRPTRLLVELTAAPDAPRAATALAAAAAAQAFAEGAALAAAQALPGGPLARALGAAGFLRVPARLNPKPFRMVALDYAVGGGRVVDPAAWDFAWGDMDVV